MASIGKALFDYLYLKPIPRAMRAKGVSLANELRLNLSSLSQRNKQTFEEFVQLSQSEKMMKILGISRSIHGIFNSDLQHTIVSNRPIDE